MLQKISTLIRSLKGMGYNISSPLIIALASLSYPDNDKILDAVKSKFGLDESKASKVSRFLALKNLSLTESDDESAKNEAASAEKMAETFLRNNVNLKQELEEAQKLWETWGSWSPSQHGGSASRSEAYNPMTPEEEDFVDAQDTTGVHTNLGGAKPGLSFSIPGVPLTSDKQPKNFYYLSPFNDKGELMDVDDFFSYYIKNGVVPINVGQTGSIFFEQFLNTAEDIFDMDETAVTEYIGLMKMEDFVYRDLNKGKSRFFTEEKNPNDISDMMSPDQQMEYDEEQQEYEEQRRLQVEQERLKSLVGETKKNLLSAKEQARISAKPNEEISVAEPSALNVGEEAQDILKIISYVFGLGPEVKTNLTEEADVYKLIYSDLSGFYALFNNDKGGWEKIANFIAENNIELFISLRLYRIYKPEEFEFSEKALEKSIESRDGLNIFYKAKLWKELPPHFIELVAEKDPYKFFKSEIFVSGQASDRAIGIASATLINHYVDPNLANYWINLGISSKVPKSHFDSIIKLLAEQDPARFLAWTSKDGKKLSDFYPEEKETAEENFLGIARDLPYENPIAFFSPPFPGSKKLWADYYAVKSEAEKRVNHPRPRTMEEGISAAIKTAKELLQRDGIKFSAEWMKAGLHRFPKLKEITDLAVDEFIQSCESFEKIYGYDTSLTGADPEAMADIKEYIDSAVKDPSKVKFSNYDDKASYPVILSGIKEYLDQI